MPNSVTSTAIAAIHLLGVVFTMSNKIEIIGVGYGKDVNIGESYLQESVVNMWDFPPKGAFTYYSASGSTMILRNVIKTGKDTYTSIPLSIDEVGEDIKKALVAKGQRVLK